MRILLIDNYDSFTYNLVDYLEQGGAIVTVIRNDSPDLKNIDRQEYTGVVLSPGPGRPQDAGDLMPFIDEHLGHISMLGICLGHQAIGLQLGAVLDYALEPRHGKHSELNIVTDHPVWTGVKRPAIIMRYHSLVLTHYNKTKLQPLAYSADDQTLMAFYSEEYKSVGLQFHPESIGSLDGLTMIKNWLLWI